ncbi:hypothetical protein [Myxococcus sp. RHSTA-1-4]|uniref:hypothetical protein n=1 Tax=Myxococcus sp. RHSTA-1-4 TaxID=2874601 RepID=UPI001CBB871A|nr:hypothetical protein [Myxococcus sp. RHSTA-1-4]MBZ4422442.1 hypothetical protein [Myxococcus sp. RHSTA-1-4]
MTSRMALSEAQQVIGRRWSPEQPPEQERILGLARDALDFISATGQWYLFVDFRRSGASGVSAASCGEGSPELRELLGRTERFFQALLDAPHASGEQASLQLIIEALRFISATRQHESFSDFVEHVATHAPPFIVAAFETRQEAEAWLENHANPPDSARILVGDTYHDVVYDRDTGFRRLPWNRDLHHYLAWLKQVEPPVATASFSTRQEAEEWLTKQPHPARRTWVLIAGELHLAAYYPNINHRALFPLSISEGERKMDSPPRQS